MNHSKCYTFRNKHQIDLTPISGQTKNVVLPDSRKIAYGICHTLTKDIEGLPDGCYGQSACIYSGNEIIATFQQNPLKISQSGVDMEFGGSYRHDNLSVKVLVSFYYDHIGFESEPHFV